VEEVDSGLLSLAAETGVGAEILGPREWLRIPRAGRQDLARILNAAEKEGMWPWQALQVLVHLVPQPGKPKDRAIGCLPMLVRLHGKLRKAYPDRWSEERAGFWDEAVRGSSALQAALKRALTDEAACLMGATAGGIYLDIQGFYDNIDLEKLFSCCLSMGYPRRVLILSFLAYLSPRWLTQGGWVTEAPVQPLVSLVTGERNGNNMARVATYDIMEDYHKSVGLRAPAYQWVDDLTAKAVGTAETVRSHLVEAAAFLEKALTADGYTVSPKSKVVASKWTLAQQVEEALRRRGIRSAKAALRTTDLCLDAAGGFKLTKPKHGARKRVAGTRVGGYMRLRGAGGATVAKLFRTGALPKYSYGSRAYGAHPAEVEHARRALGVLLTGAKAGRCLTTALCIGQPKWQDPAISMRVGFTQQWLDLWSRSKDLRGRVTRAWPLARAAMESGSSRSRWRRSAGALSGIILTLMDIGWKPISALEWHTDIGEVWQLPGEEDDAEEMNHIAPVLMDVRSSSQRPLWKRAAGHHLGQDLGEGFVQEQPRLRLKQLGLSHASATDQGLRACCRPLLRASSSRSTT
jgi:hypothetical protein